MRITLRRFVNLAVLLSLLWMLYLYSKISDQAFLTDKSRASDDDLSIHVTSRSNVHLFDMMKDLPSNRIVKVESQEPKTVPGAFIKNDNVHTSNEKETSASESKVPTDAGQKMSERKEDQEEGEDEKVLVKNVFYPKFVTWSPPDGPGENGVPFKVNKSRLTEEEKNELNEGKEHNSFNQFASDQISVRRRLPDSRHADCLLRPTVPDLLQASVIICFHNEAWSVLLRSIHSILDRSPPNLLREIILVDDFSDMSHLKEPLEAYVKPLEKVKVIRAQKRQGLIRGRLIGYEAASAPYLVFLDSHIECFPGWLEPLLEPIHADRRVSTVPNIPAINSETLAVRATLVDQVGKFKWRDFSFDWMIIPEEERHRRKSVADNIGSPTMPGGLFAIAKDRFTELGTYDPALDHWGGENLELSFKLWMCNGSILMVPCSIVGHIFRVRNPIKWDGKSPLTRNSLHVAEVWLDNYKNFFTERLSPTELKDVGDLTERKALRKRLHCHDFQWYHKNVYPSMDLPNAVYAGQISSDNQPSLCLDSMGEEKKLILYSCHGLGGNQFWMHNEKGELHQDDKFVCVTNAAFFLANSCNEQSKTWELTEKFNLRHLNSSMCLNAGNGTLTLQSCKDIKEQQWTLTKRKWTL